MLGHTLKSFTLNGSNWTSGSSHTVSGNVTVVSSAVASAIWRTVWEGIVDVTAKTTANNKAEKTGTFPGVMIGFPTRLTGTCKTGSTLSPNFTNIELTTEYSAITFSTLGGEQFAKIPTSSNQIQFKVGGWNFQEVGVRILKVQQYY